MTPSTIRRCDAEGEDARSEVPSTVTANILLGVLMVATLAWGCVSREASAAWTAVVCGLGCAGIAAMLVRGTHLSLVPGSLPLVCFIAFTLFQVVPFGVTLSTAARDASGMTQSAAISWIPAATLSQGRRWIALFIVFTMGALLFCHPRRMRHLPWAMLLLAGVLSSYYALHPFLEYVPADVAGLREGAFSRHVFGTYLNRNHLAAFLVMAIVLGIGLFVTRHRILGHRSPGFARRQAYILAMISLSAVGLLLTQSRGGMINLVVGILALAVLAPRRPTGRGRWTPVFAILGLVAALPFALPPGFAARFLDIARDLSTDGSRRDVWQSAWHLFATSPLVGHGLGTFGDLAVLSQSPNLQGHLEHAHCDALECLVESGLLGFNLLLWAGGLLARHVVRRCRTTRGDRRTVLAAAAIAALLGMAAQSLVDFSGQIPALAGWAAILAGAAGGAMATAHGRPRAGLVAPRWLLPPVMVALGLCAAFAGRESWSYSLQNGIQPGARGSAARRSLASAGEIHACRGEAWSRSAWLAVAHDTPRREFRTIRSDAARALRINPFDARAWRAMAFADIVSGEPSALSTLHRAVRLTPPGDREKLRLEFGMGLLAADRTTLAASWFGELFADPGVDTMAVLRRLHAADATHLDLVPLIARAGRASLGTFADSLLHNGEIRKREKILDLLLARAPNRDRITLGDGMTLVGKHVEETFDASRHRLHVELTFEVASDPPADPRQLCLRLLGDHAVVQLDFQPRAGTTHLTLEVPASLPPGAYDLALQSPATDTPFPLRLVTIEATGMHLTPGRTLPAERVLYQEFVDPANHAAAAGLGLAPGTRLWRRIRLSDPGGVLILSSTTTTPIRVVFNGTRLRRVNAATSTDARYRLPSRIAEGVLEIALDHDSSGNDAATRILRVSLVAEARR